MKNAEGQNSEFNDRKVITNRKAFRDYHVIQKFEAGISLEGPEVKSIRAGQCSLNESYARLDNGQVFLHGFHIQPYEKSRRETQLPTRLKRLLLHRREIDRLFGQMTLKGRTLIPLTIYFKRGLVKVEMGLCEGRQSEDKREVLRRKTAEREAERAIASRWRRG